MRYLKLGLLALFSLLLICFSGSAFPVILEEEVVEEKIPYDYDLSPYITLGDVSSIRADFEDPTLCTEKEIDDAVFRILLEMAEFTEKNKPAARYYKVKIDFSIEKDGEVLPSYSQKDYELVIGASDENPVEYLLGEKLMGAVVGEERRVNYTYPEELIGTGLSGEEVTLCAVVKAVYQYELPTLNNRTVGELFGGEFETVKDFRESVKKDILTQKETNRAQAVWLALCGQVRVRSYPEAELSDYIAVYKARYMDMAEEYGMTLSQFVENYLQMDMEEFLSQGEAVAKEKVKNDMIFTQLVRDLNVSVSEEEYIKEAQEYFSAEEGDFNSFEEFEAYYTKENLLQNILWDKALKIVIEHARPN